MTRFRSFLIFCLLGSAGAALYAYQVQNNPFNVTDLKKAQDLPAERPAFTQASTLSGAYLCARSAQRHFDWRSAGSFISQVMHETPDDPALLKRAMVLAMGSGDVEKALGLARRAEKAEGKPGALSELFMAIGDFKARNYKSAQKHIKSMPEGGLSVFILPLLNAWASASTGQSDTSSLNQNTLHLYHAILIDDFLGKRGNIEKLLEQSLKASDLGADDLTRIGNLYAQIGKTQQAQSLYEEALSLSPGNPDIAQKLDALKRGEKEFIFTPIKNAEDGVAEALFDMARLLTQEYSDESARIFVQMAIYLNPSHTKARFLLASLAARNESLEEAIEIYRSISKDNPQYAEARRMAAELLDESGHKDEAVKELELLVSENKDVDALIQIGDIHRISEDFDRAIAAYNKAQQLLGGKISSEYWHLHYVRGMAYEQAGQWPKAEEDLKAALDFQPSHPYILNYLGYAWTDQGTNLDEALGMIERAVNSRPDDGFIADSLGWVYYKMGNFREAVPALEQAVELMPYDPTINDHLGDAYWSVGRKREARFQWERAKNHSQDSEAIKALDDKIAQGLPETQNESALAKTDTLAPAQASAQNLQSVQ